MTNPRYRAAAYVKKNRLCILGVYMSKRGPIPFSYACQCKAEDGKIDIGGNVPPNVVHALDKGQERIMRDVKKKKLSFAIQSLVERSRAGDQNAIAMIVMIRENAKKGSKKAKRTQRLLEHYVTGNPVADFGADNTGIKSPKNAQIFTLNCELRGKDCTRAIQALTTMDAGLSKARTAAVLANGPALYGNTLRLKNLVDSLEPEAEKQKSIVAGVLNWKNPRTDYYGSCIGLARTMQLVAARKASIGSLSKMAAWELGE